MTHPKTSVPWGHDPDIRSCNAWDGTGQLAVAPAHDLYGAREVFGEYKDHFLGGRLPAGPPVNTLLPIVGQPVGPSLLTRVVGPGSKGDEVSQLQQFLNGRLDPPPGLTDHGFFDAQTMEAVQAFQKASGINPTGKVESKTWFKLLFGGRVPWPGQRPKGNKQPFSAAKHPIAGWAVKDKFDAVFVKCGLQLPGDLRFTFQQMVDYGTRQGLAVILTTWSGALLTNGNETTDFGLRALLMGQIEVESLDVIEDFNACLVATSNASQQVHLEHAATYMARVVTRTGVALFLALIHRVATKHEAKQKPAAAALAASSKAGAAIDMRTGISEQPKTGKATPTKPTTTAPPAPAQYKNIEITGSESFKQQVLAALADISKTKSGAALLADIGTRGKTVTITETSNGNCCGTTTDGWMLPDGKPGKGSASTVEFNPARKSIGSEAWETRPPAIGLAHELIHAAHNAIGTNNRTQANNDSRPDPADPSKTAQTRSEEVRTVGLAPFDKESYSENSIRNEWNPKQPTRPWY